MNVTMFRSNLQFPSSGALAVAFLSFKTSEHLPTTRHRNLNVCSFQHLAEESAIPPVESGRLITRKITPDKYRVRTDHVTVWNNS